mmetsp:Transcript_96327/g.311029  ORF Transcript_96327/g.311029 Transcript_96327/m.311029 type:complete len:225 (+) Transcript_96327:410-1084(+)
MPHHGGTQGVAPSRQAGGPGRAGGAPELRRERGWARHSCCGLGPGARGQGFRAQGRGGGRLQPRSAQLPAPSLLLWPRGSRPASAGPRGRAVPPVLGGRSAHALGHPLRPLPAGSGSRELCPESPDLGLRGFQRCPQLTLPRSSQLHLLLVLGQHLDARSLSRGSFLRQVLGAALSISAVTAGHYARQLCLSRLSPLSRRPSQFLFSPLALVRSLGHFPQGLVQ